MKKTGTFNLREEREFDARLRNAERNAAMLGELRPRVIHDGKDYQLTVSRTGNRFVAEYIAGHRAGKITKLAMTSGKNLGECLDMMLKWQNDFLYKNPKHKSRT